MNGSIGLNDCVLLCRCGCTIYIPWFMHTVHNVLCFVEVWYPYRSGLLEWHSDNCILNDISSPAHANQPWRICIYAGVYSIDARNTNRMKTKTGPNKTLRKFCGIYNTSDHLMSNCEGNPIGNVEIITIVCCEHIKSKIPFLWHLMGISLLLNTKLVKPPVLHPWYLASIIVATQVIANVLVVHKMPVNWLSWL